MYLGKVCKLRSVTLAYQTKEGRAVGRIERDRKNKKTLFGLIFLER